MRFLNLLLFVAISFLPVYLWSSGGLQPSHYLLAIFCGAYLVSQGVGRGFADGLLMALTLMVFFREGLEVLLGASVISLLPAAHMIYSLMVFNVLRRATASRSAIKIVISGVFASTIIAVGGVMLLGYGLTIDSSGTGEISRFGVRAIGTFNTPNQLGYFAVCLFSLAFLFRLRFRLGAQGVGFLVVCSVFLAVVSLSNAAMIGIGIALLFAGFASTNRQSATVLGVLSLALISLLAYWLYSAGMLDDYYFVQRIESIGSQSDDSLAGRGYGLFFDSTALTLFFGFGFIESLSKVGHEVHSTIFSYFTYYGVLGGSLFLGFILLWVRRVWLDLGIWGLFLVVSPVLFYGITHNGSRFAIFWVLVALSFSNDSQGQNGNRSALDNLDRVNGRLPGK